MAAPLDETHLKFHTASIEGAISWVPWRRYGRLTVRGVNDRIVAALKLRAAKHRRSTEPEHRAILEEALGENATDFWKDAAQLRAELAGRRHSDSGEILRAERDRRNQPGSYWPSSLTTRSSTPASQ